MHRQNGHAPIQGTTSHHRSQSSYNGPMPIPAQMSGQTRDNNSFGMARSPPALPGKNTKHVPCKFFRQGQCQAGNSCPFSHNLDPMANLAPCKYFMKGNCKFGNKCMLGHYLSNGNRVNKCDLNSYRDMTNRTNGMNSRHNEESLQYPPREGQSYDAPPFQEFGDEVLLDDVQADWNETNHTRYDGAFRNLNAFDIPVGSPPTSQVGSPPNDTRRWPSALDAPLPPSWQGGVPNYITQGHISDSLPGNFGMMSPPLSANSGIGTPPSIDHAHRHQSQNARSTALEGLSAHVESSIGGKLMHSQLNQIRSKQMMSVSVPVRDSLMRPDTDASLDLVPRDLVDDVLTPGEQMRRASRSDQDFNNSFKDDSNGLAIPRHGSAVGSPPAAGSPSRFRGIFQQQQQEKEKSSHIGAVGSPLRESWLSNGNSSFSGRQSIQLSGISQALGRMSMDRADSSEANTLRPNSIRGGYARQISSPGLHPRIDEEGDPATFFPMDSDDGTRRGLNAWTDNDPSSSRHSTDDFNPQQGVPIKNGNRPVFGFHR